MCTLALKPTQPPTECIPQACSQGRDAKQPGHTADHSSPSSAQIKHPWTNTAVPLMPSGLQSKTCPSDRGISAVNFVCRDAYTFTETAVPLNPILSYPLCSLIY